MPPSGPKGRTSDRALPRLTEQHDGSRRIIEDPPLVTRPSEGEYDRAAEALDGYLQTLPPHWGRILGGYHLIDIAHKVVGVGSVGLRATSPCAKAATPTTRVPTPTRLNATIRPW